MRWLSKLFSKGDEMRDTQVLDQQFDTIQSDHHEEGEACCLGCKVDELIANLEKSDIPSDRVLGSAFKQTLRYHQENEARRDKNSTRYKPC